MEPYAIMHNNPRLVDVLFIIFKFHRKRIILHGGYYEEKSVNIREQRNSRSAHICTEKYHCSVQVASNAN